VTEGASAPFDHPDPSSAFTKSSVHQTVKNPNEGARLNGTHCEKASNRWLP
jgi:hypothetical protein